MVLRNDSYSFEMLIFNNNDHILNHNGRYKGDDNEVILMTKLNMMAMIMVIKTISLCISHVFLCQSNSRRVRGFTRGNRLT